MYIDPTFEKNLLKIKWLTRTVKYRNFRQSETEIFPLNTL